MPKRGTRVPSGPDWIHEIKYAGYRMLVVREGDRMRLLTRGGHDWTDRYPWIVETARRMRQKQFVIDGEAVVLVSTASPILGHCTRATTMRKCSSTRSICWAGDGDDFRKLPLSMRKTNLARLLARRSDGIFAAPFEAGKIGPDLFQAACNMGLQGMVSKHRNHAVDRSPILLPTRDHERPLPLQNTAENRL